MREDLVGRGRLFGGESGPSSQLDAVEPPWAPTTSGRLGSRERWEPPGDPIATAIDLDGASWPYWGRRTLVRAGGAATATATAAADAAGRQWPRGFPATLAGFLERRDGLWRRNRSVSRIFGASPDVVSSVRSLVRTAALRWRLVGDDLELLVDELATNCVVHGRTPFSVSLTARGSTARGLTVRVEVSDRSPALPYVQDAGLYSTDGRGMVVVEHLAGRWGCDAAVSGGKRVWAEIDTPRRRWAPRPSPHQDEAG